MASRIASQYQAAFASLVGQSFTSKEIRVIMVAMFPDVNPSSLNPSDYRGTRQPDGTITRAGSQASQYAPLLFENVGGLYKVLPQSEQVAKPVTGRSLRGVSDAAVLAELQRRGVLPAPAPAAVIPDVAVLTEAELEAATAPASA